MSILEQPYLGHISDPLDSDEDQCDINEELLREHDGIELLKSMDYRLSEPMLKFLVSNLDINNIGFFTILLNKIIKTYHLNYLKLYKETIIVKNDYVKNIVSLVKYIKIRLIGLIENKELDKDITRDELEKFLMIDNAPNILIECIKYIDATSYEKFINKIFLEYKKEFI